MKQNPNPKYTFPIGERIKYFRQKKGITVNKLANLAGISQSYLRDIEMGNKNPTIEIVALICQALNISLKDFFDNNTDTSLLEDPLISKIFELNNKQKKALLYLLETFSNS